VDVRSPTRRDGRCARDILDGGCHARGSSLVSPAEELEIADGAVRGIRSVANPEKLGHLGPVANFGEMLKESRPVAGG